MASGGAAAATNRETVRNAHEGTETGNYGNKLQFEMAQRAECKGFHGAQEKGKKGDYPAPDDRPQLRVENLAHLLGQGIGTERFLQESGAGLHQAMANNGIIHVA